MSLIYPLSPFMISMQTTTLVCTDNMYIPHTVTQHTTQVYMYVQYSCVTSVHVHHSNYGIYSMKINSASKARCKSAGNFSPHNI